MAKAQAIHATTQAFTEVEDIVDDIVIFKNSYAALIIEVRATNFALMSKQEQDAKLFAYAALLNSLSFPIQILIRSKEIDISSYIKLLEGEIQKTQNELLATHILLYRDFVQELVKVNTVLDKQFYIVIPYSYLEQGAVATVSTTTKGRSNTFADQARSALHSKATSLHSQLTALALPAKTLQKDELVKLFYSIYNEGAVESAEVAADVNAPIVKKGEAN